METDDRTFGDLFYACCDEVADISLKEALWRMLVLATDRLKQLGRFCEKTAAGFFDAIIDRRAAVHWLVKEQIGDRLNPIPKVR